MNFDKSLKSYLNVKLRNLDIDEQYNTLKSFKILPLQLRFFQNMVYFIFSLIKGNRKNRLLQTINACKKIRSTRMNFVETALYQYSSL